MTLLRFILLLQGIGAVFVAGGLFFKYPGVRNRSIALFVLLFGFEIFEFLYSTSQIVYLYPYFYGLFFFPAGFLYGPLLFIHFKSLSQKVYLRNAIWHLIPFLLVTASLWDYFMMSGADRIVYSNEHFLTRIMPYNYARSIHILLYGIADAWYLRHLRHRQEVKERFYAVSINIIYFLSAVVVSILTWFADGWRDFIIYYLTINTLVGLIGYLLYTNPDFLKSLSKKYLSSSLNEEELARIQRKIISAFEKEKLFLERDMTLQNLSIHIGENAHHISQTLSESMKKNFNEHLNECRVAYAKNLLSNPKFQHYKIEAIALESGFNNKVTFHKAFIKYTALTPAAFRAQNAETGIA